EGTSLEKLLARLRRIPDAERSLIAARYAGRLLAALSHIHARGVVHGDVKPSNILFARRARGTPAAKDLRLVDFGLSFTLGTSEETARGTPRYMAPEVLRGAPPDAASDLFSLGAVLRSLRDAPGGGSGSSAAFAARLGAFVARLAEPSRSLRYRRAEE